MMPFHVLYNNKNELISHYLLFECESIYFRLGYLNVALKMRVATCSMCSMYILEIP